MKKILLLTVVAVVALMGVCRSETLIDPSTLTATASSQLLPDTAPSKAVDGTGLTGDTHASSHVNCWLSNGPTVGNEWFKVDLGASYNLAKMKFWNYHQAGCCTNRGMKKADIYVSDTGTGTPATNPGQWVLVILDQVFTEAPVGSNSNPDIISLGYAPARFVLIDVDSNWGDPSYVGIAEVQFFEESQKVINQSPANDEYAVNRGGVVFSWDLITVVGPTTTDITVGTDPNLTSLIIDNVAATSPYSLASALPNNGTRYYWRVDVTDNGVEYVGEVLSFTTSGKAYLPVPADGAAGIMPSVTLDWTGDNLGGSYEVFFGTAPGSLSSLGKVNSPAELPVQELDLSTTYYWRVDELDGSGVAYATGDVWSFTTGALIGHWALDGDATDSSGNGNDGTITGEVSMISGPLGQAARFYGANGAITVPETDLLDTERITISAWIDPKNVSTIGDVVNKRNASNEGGYVMEIDQSQLKLYLDMESGWNQVAASVSTGGWQHFVATYDGMTMKLYRNGELVSENAVESTIKNTNGNLMIGVDPFGRVFNGTIDDVRIYNYAIGESEVQELYENSPFAKNVAPVDGSDDVSPFTDLEWLAGAGAVSHNLYLGTGTDANGITDLIITETGLTSTLYTPSTEFELDTTYYWQVDEVNNDANVIEGQIWSFTTVPPKAYGPSPANKATKVDINADISWSEAAGSGGPYTHHVHFGTSEGSLTEVVVLPSATTTFDPGTLDWSTTYLWRIDEEDGGGKIITGDVWSFTTVVPVCGTQVGDLNGDCVVNLEDFAALAANWLECGLTPVEACP